MQDFVHRPYVAPWIRTIAQGESNPEFTGLVLRTIVVGGESGGEYNMKINL